MNDISGRNVRYIFYPNNDFSKNKTKQKQKQNNSKHNNNKTDVMVHLNSDL